KRKNLNPVFSVTHTPVRRDYDYATKSAAGRHYAIDLFTDYGANAGTGQLFHYKRVLRDTDLCHLLSEICRLSDRRADQDFSAGRWQYTGCDEPLYDGAATVQCVDIIQPVDSLRRHKRQLHLYASARQ